ncbi:MAG: sodium:solute symporter family protein [Acidaminococcales bacterium]|jgi:Na+/proline symporter|nr:sodium:solute symporter family protein [Acidaminococcales bacterium]
MEISVFNCIFFSFLIVYLGVTFYVGRGGVSLKDFYVMDQGASPFLIAGTYAATWISAVGMVGLTGMSYKTGPLTGILDWAATIGFVMSTFWIGNKLRRTQQVTLGDFFGERFDSQTLRAVTALITIFGLGAYFVGQIIGSAIVTETLLGIPYSYMVVVMVVVFMVIALGAGAKSVTITDTIMMLLIVVALAYVFSPMLISTVGIDAFSKFAKEKPDWFTSGGGVYTWGTIVGWQVLWSLGNAANPSAITRCFLAKNSRTWTKAMILAMMATFSVIWLTHLAASSVYLVNPNLSNPGAALTWAAMNVVNPVVGAIAIAGLFGACLSTASTQILTLSFSIARDFYEKIFYKEASDAQILRVARIWIIVFSVLGAAIALYGSSLIVVIGNFGSSIFTCSFFAPLIFGLNWRKMNKRGAIWAMIVGAAINTGLHFIPLAMGKPFGWSGWLPLGLHPTIWAAIASILTAYFASFGGENTSKALAVYDTCNHVSDEEKASNIQSGSLTPYIIALVVYTIVQTSLVLWFASKVA